MHGRGRESERRRDEGLATLAVVSNSYSRVGGRSEVVPLCCPHFPFSSHPSIRSRQDMQNRVGGGNSHFLKLEAKLASLKETSNGNSQCGGNGNERNTSKTIANSPKHPHPSLTESAFGVALQFRDCKQSTYLWVR